MMYQCSKKLVEYKEYNCFDHSDLPAHSMFTFDVCRGSLDTSIFGNSSSAANNTWSRLPSRLSVSDDYEITIITNDPIFFICFSSSICWYISFLHFKTFKVQFCGVPCFHYVLVCKIHIYMQKMTLSSLLT